MNKGFIPVMLTPYTATGKVDYDGLTQLTEYYLQAGARGLFANCLSSEMYELTEEERIHVVKHVVKVANGTVPVVATGTFDKTLEKQAEFIKRINDTGTQAVIAITSIIAEKQESDEVFNERVFKLLEATEDIPIGFYECPVPYKRLLSAQQLALFVKTGRVTYHKDTCLDITQVREKIKAGEGHSFGLYDAYMVNAVKSLKAGAAGLSCIQGNYFPRLIVWLCDNYDKPELLAEVAMVQEFFVRHMDVMHDHYPLSAKYCLQKQGLNISTLVRIPGQSAAIVDTRKIDALLNEYLELERTLQLEVPA
ncbi:dihydrodipicolinate synthase family protein [Flavisolibacter tropicus]|uniref:Dihydrodipicolinate synthetase n=1 Tax=Flavisolibacter tropicus TaxID=1492898 RepID=A0A172U2T4_9BACT|nr:dihydrodipicolinate synthase family protein [Flavisolibacter tropicus]ANE53444.1 dihydrodipicolinate synthetase [Flavisolibacter tropicus]